MPKDCLVHIARKSCLPAWLMLTTTVRLVNMDETFLLFQHSAVCCFFKMIQIQILGLVNFYEIVKSSISIVRILPIVTRLPGCTLSKRSLSQGLTVPHLKFFWRISSRFCWVFFYCTELHCLIRSKDIEQHWCKKQTLIFMFM